MPQRPSNYQAQHSLNGSTAHYSSKTSLEKPKNAQNSAPFTQPKPDSTPQKPSTRSVHVSDSKINEDRRTASSSHYQVSTSTPVVAPKPNRSQPKSVIIAPKKKETRTFTDKRKSNGYDKNIEAMVKVQIQRDIERKGEKQYKADKQKRMEKEMMRLENLNEENERYAQRQREEAQRKFENVGKIRFPVEEEEEEEEEEEDNCRVNIIDFNNPINAKFGSAVESPVDVRVKDQLEKLNNKIRKSNEASSSRRSTMQSTSKNSSFTPDEVVIHVDPETVRDVLNRREYSFDSDLETDGSDFDSDKDNWTVEKLRNDNSRQRKCDLRIEVDTK